MTAASRPNRPVPDRPPWLPWDAFPFQTRFADIDGKAIHYVDAGSGPALVFVSTGQWSFIFRDVILLLRGQFRCLALDFPGSGLSPHADDHDQSVGANARILDSFIDALDLQDITLVLHDAGGPAGFLAVLGRPQRFRALVLSNTFGWPLADYPAVLRMLTIVTSPLARVINDRTNVMALFAATSYGVGRNLSRADRRAFLGPWRSRTSRQATLQVLAGVRDIDPLMADVERSLASELAELPVLTLFGRKNDRYGWQARFGRVFATATDATIRGGRHFPFSDDPEGYSTAIQTWWANKVCRVQPIPQVMKGTEK